MEAPFFITFAGEGSSSHSTNAAESVPVPALGGSETTHALVMAEPLPQQPEPQGIHWKCGDCARMVLRHHKICICGAPKPVETVPVKGTRFGFKATLPNGSFK